LSVAKELLDQLSYSRGFERGFINTLGYRTHYIHGGGGEPLVLVHGGGAGADAIGNWAGKCFDLLTQSRRVIALDMVGFGHSDAPDPAEFDYSPESRIEQLIAFIEALGVGAVDVVGNSMGGRTAAAVAAKRPELVKNLVLMGSAGLDRGMDGALRALVEYDFTYVGMQRIVEALTHDGFQADPAMIEYRLDISKQAAQRQAFTATIGKIKHRGGLFLDPEEIASIGHRTLVVNGKDDKVISIEQALGFLKLIKNSTGVLLPHCGHWAMIEHPEKFAEITLQFLAGKL
jgi:pimeloyl-ACP methyl ester carboxylesterase